MKLVRTIGFILLAFYLILIGIAGFDVAIPAVLLNILAVVSGALILIGKCGSFYDKCSDKGDHCDIHK